MKLDWMADELRQAGLNVVEHSGWKERTMRPFIAYQPVGLINHHTAGSAVIPNYPDPPFYRDEALESKCNLTIRPDGVVVCLNAGWAFDSGLGVPAVLEAVRNDRPLPPFSLFDASDSTMSGNAYFIDIEVQHLGNGSPIVPVQRDALIRTNAVICRRMSWNPMTRLIGHLEWAPKRKTDPRWDGNKNPMPRIREDTVSALDQTQEDTMFCKQGDRGPIVEYWQRILMQLAPGYKPAAYGVFDAAMTKVVQDLTGPGDNIGPGEAAALHIRLGVTLDQAGNVDLSGYSKVGHGHQATISLD